MKIDISILMFIFKMCKQTTVILSTIHSILVGDCDSMCSARHAHFLTTLCLPQCTRFSLAYCCQVVSIS